MASFDCSTCGHKCHTHGGLSRHKTARHPTFPTPNESTRHKRIRHQFLDGKFNFDRLEASFSKYCQLSARPCTKDGAFLNKFDPQTPPPSTLVDPPENVWAPFRDRLEFDWAYYHYVRLQSSKSEILEGLDLWRAAVIKHCSEHLADAIPWRNADDLYQTIDCIQDGDAPWRCYKFIYSGPKPVNPPRWMEEAYELNARDVLLVLEQQLDTPDFHGEADYAAYMEFNANGDRVYSNIMSAHWVSREAVSFTLNLLSLST